MSCNCSLGKASVEADAIKEDFERWLTEAGRPSDLFDTKVMPIAPYWLIARGLMDKTAWHKYRDDLVKTKWDKCTTSKPQNVL